MQTFATRSNSRRTFAFGLGFGCLAALMTVWTTIVRDDGQGAASFMVVLAAGVGAFAVRLHAAGMARAMCGVAAMQMCLALLFATAPSTAALPDGPLRALVWGAILAALWLLSAACFRAVARG